LIWRLVRGVSQGAGCQQEEEREDAMDD
jgi:hypothetical protein